MTAELHMANWLADKAAMLLLTIATVGWYLACRAATDALAGGALSPGRRALGFWAPAAMTVFVAILAKRAEVAVGVIFASSVACLTLVLGIATVAASPSGHSNLRQERIWGFVLPAALIALLIGFSGQVRWTHAIMLTFLGVALVRVWNDPASNRGRQQPAFRAIGWRTAQFIMALIAAAVAAWAAVYATDNIGKSLNLPANGLVAALILSPALILPLIGYGSVAAAAGRYEEAIALQVGFVLLNLCALLPAASLLWLVRSGEALPYPLAVWRVDTVMLVAAGLLLLAVSLGRWTPGRFEGVCLIVAYVIYMVLTTAMAR